jgi:hypothetical protein
MVTFKGEVKIGNIEHCKHDGSLSQFSESFSRIVMNLMDKTRPRSGPIGLTNLDHWSAAAFNFFTFTTSLPSLDKLQAHSFLENRRHQDLLWVIPYVLVSSRHFLDEFDDENMKEGGVPSEGSLN